MLTIILLIVLFASVAMLVREGLWSNTITLINVVTAALLATNLWEPVADWLESQAPTYTYLLDFLAIWLVFCASFILLRAITDQLSRVQVRFKKPVNLAGGGIMGLWVGWVLVCFTAMTLHMAPLGLNTLGLSGDPAQSTFLIFSPDRQWLAFAQKVSRGSLSTSPPEGVTGEAGANVFDPRAEFVYKYAQRRAEFEKEPLLRVNR